MPQQIYQPQEDNAGAPEQSSTIGAADIKRHLPAAAGAIGALGTGAALYRALRKRTLSTDPALRAIQLASKGKYTRVLPGTAKDRGYLGRFVDKYLATGGGKVIYQGDAQKAFNAANKTRVVPGVVHHSDRAFDSVVSGAGGNLAANQATRDLHGLIKNDKWKEYKFFQRYARGAMGHSESLANVMRQLGYEKLPNKPVNRRIFLRKLENHLKKRYGKGFLIKDTLSAETAGSFPTEKTPFVDLYERYTAADPRGKLKQMVQEQGAGLDASALKALRKKLRAQVSAQHQDVYAGRVFEKMFKNPELAMVQAKLPLAEGSWFGKMLGRLTNKPATRELRLHVVNGALVPSMTIPRFDPSMYITRRGRKQMREAEEYARGLLAKMPRKYRQGTFAMDVAPLKGGGYALIESNPSGVSGFYNPEKMPIIGPIMHKAFTGQHSRGVSGALAGGGALAAGAGIYGLGKKFVPTAPDQENQSSNPKMASYRFREARARVKRAAVGENDEDSYSSTLSDALPAVAATAAGASPFLGLIGQKKLIHDPTYNSKIKRMSRLELERLARPGDILVASKGAFDWYKAPQEAVSGSPFYHVEPVVTRRGGRGRTMDAGHIFAMEGPVGTRSRKHMREYSRSFAPHEDMVLLRPKKPISPEQMKKYLADITAGGSHEYQKLNAVTAWLHDLFVPKLRKPTKARYECKGGICSTVPGQALANIQRDVVKGVGARQLMPADFLRSKNYDVVGASLTTPQKATFARKVMPYAARAGLGALLAAGAYQGTKYLTKKLNERSQDGAELKTASDPDVNVTEDVGTYRFNRAAELADIADAEQYVFRAHDRKPQSTGDESGQGVTFQEGVSG